MSDLLWVVGRAATQLVLAVGQGVRHGRRQPSCCPIVTIRPRGLGYTRSAIEAVFASATEGDARKIVGGNAKELFGL